MCGLLFGLSYVTEKWRGKRREWARRRTEKLQRTVHAWMLMQKATEVLREMNDRQRKP